MLLLLPFLYSAASNGVDSETAEHWAHSSLKKGQSDGLTDSRSSTLLPDSSITWIDALDILCRAFGAQPLGSDASPLLHGDVEDAHVSDVVSRALHLGLLKQTEGIDFLSPISRQDAFALVAEAFQLHEVEGNMGLLERFSDVHLLRDENRTALTALVSHGYIEGSNGALLPDSDMTLASFITVIYRIIGRFVPSRTVGGNVVYSAVLQGSAKLADTIFVKTVWFDCAATDIALDNVSAGNIIIRSQALKNLAIGGITNIIRMTIASASGDIAISPGEYATVETLQVGTGGGVVTISKIDNIEITGSNREIEISGNAESLVISGVNNTVYISQGIEVNNIRFLPTAEGCRIITDGAIGTMEIRSFDVEVSGTGSAETIRFYRPAIVDIACKDLIDATDYGLAEASVILLLPQFLPIGEALVAEAYLENAQSEISYDLVWYLNDEAVLTASVTAEDELPPLIHEFLYSSDMGEDAQIKVEINYTTKAGEEQSVSCAGSVDLENYSLTHWMSLDAPWVLEKVTLGYKGDFTLDWALENDLTDYEKEVWINAKGYTSRTDYLLWINLAYQRVNIFLRREDNTWELIRTCLVGTGAPGRGTPPGVWTTSYKQLHGWTTASYTVKPVVRFRDSSGYAFHSRLYYPNTTNLRDSSIGYPISLGCVRMYDEDIWFIYDNVPDRTTVVVH